SGIQVPLAVFAFTEKKASSRLADAEQKRRIHRLKPERLELFGAASDIYQQYLDLAGQRLERHVSRVEHFQRGNVDDQPAARTYLGICGFQEPRNFATGAADEDRVRGRQVGEAGRGSGVNRLQVLGGKGLGVGQDEVIVSGILLDRIDHSGMSQ